MSGDSSVRDKTRDAVLQAAAALSYTPNRAASALGKQRQVTFAVVYTKPSEVYFRELELGFRRCAEELFDYGLNLQYFTTAESSWEAQNAILHQLLDLTELDGVIIQPVSATKLDNAINQLTARGIPVVTVGSDAPDSQRLCFVGCDAIKSGRIGGQLLAAFMGGQGHVFLDSGHSDQEQAKKRAEGLTARLNEHHPQVKVYLPSDEDRQLSTTDIITNLVKQHRIHGIFCTSGTSTVHLGQLLQRLDASHVCLVGFDLSPDAEQLMREGWIRVILDQKPDVHAYEAVKLLFSYVTNGTRPAAAHILPIFPYTSECLSPISD